MLGAGPSDDESCPAGRFRAGSEKNGNFHTGACQGTCNNVGQTVNLQYTHTFATTSYSVGASLPGGAGFTLSPGTDQWPFSVPALFTS